MQLSWIMLGGKKWRAERDCPMADDNPAFFAPKNNRNENIIQNAMMNIV